MLHCRLCFLQCDWRGEISLQKLINVNEARGISRMSPDPLSRRWGLGMRLPLFILSVYYYCECKCKVQMEGKMGPGNKTIAGTCVVWFLLSQKYTTRECHPLNLVEIYSLVPSPPQVYIIACSTNHVLFILQAMIAVVKDCGWWMRNKCCLLLA